MNNDRLKVHIEKINLENPKFEMPAGLGIIYENELI